VFNSSVAASTPTGTTVDYISPPLTQGGMSVGVGISIAITLILMGVVVVGAWWW